MSNEKRPPRTYIKYTCHHELSTLLTQTHNSAHHRLLARSPYFITQYTELLCTKIATLFKENLNASRPSENPPVRGNFVVVIVDSHIQCIILATEENPGASQLCHSRLIVILELIARIDLLQRDDCFPVPAPIDYWHAELELCLEKI